MLARGLLIYLLKKQSLEGFQKKFQLLNFGIKVRVVNSICQSQRGSFILHHLFELIIKGKKKDEMGINKFQFLY